MPAPARTTMARPPMNNAKYDMIRRTQKTALAGASTPNQGLATENFGATVTNTDLSATTALTAPLDGCPRCTHHNNPAIAARQDNHPHSTGITAVYRCTACNHNWMTSWAVN